MLLLLLGAACNAGFGPLEDHSEFVSARLADDERMVVFSFHRFAYRRATGWRAFPDGGIPRYVKDINFLGTFDRDTRKTVILRREKNTEWQPGQGQFNVNAVNGTKALISQGGQLLGPFAHGIRFLLVDFVSGAVTDLDLKSDLARFGRDTGQIYLVDASGTLLFVTLSLEEAAMSGPNPGAKPIPEIWVRSPAGDYMKVATSDHYERTFNGEVIYWELATRLFKAFSIANRSTRTASEYKVPEYKDVTVGVGISSDRQDLEFGAKTNNHWTYTPLELHPDELK